MKNLQNQVKTRLMAPADEGFVYSSWLKSYRNSPMASNLNNDVYYDNHKKIVQNTLENAVTMILCASDDEDHILGFICFEATNLNIIHYIYIKYSYRKMGLTKFLLDTLSDISDSTTIITHFNNNLKSKSNELGLIYNPYILRR